MADCVAALHHAARTGWHAGHGDRRGAAKRLQAQLRAGFERRPLVIRGLALWRYLDGPWEPVRQFVFRG